MKIFCRIALDNLRKLVYYQLQSFTTV